MLRPLRPLAWGRHGALLTVLSLTPSCTFLSMAFLFIIYVLDRVSPALVILPQALLTSKDSSALFHHV